jgi:predicted 3-demethylubiquinone-9 3-methyltransferase (glyoxalase superfamily)
VSCSPLEDEISQEAGRIPPLLISPVRPQNISTLNVSINMSFGKITTCLWFDGQAEEAANYYTSIFKDSKIITTQRFTDAGQEVHGREPGSVMVVEFELNGQRFVGLNGGPQHKFSEAVSFQVHCADQDELDYYWEKLGEGGDEAKRECGWLADKFGLSWQIVPTVLKEMLSDPDTGKANRAMMAMLGMKKLNIDGLREAYNG